jgi:hypothetical protein
MDFFEMIWMLAAGFGRVLIGIWDKAGAELNPDG